MKNLILNVFTLSCLALIGVNSFAQESIPDAKQFKESVDNSDTEGYYDRLGVFLTFTPRDSKEIIIGRLQRNTSSDKEIYDNIVYCQEQYEGSTYIPQYIADYYVNNRTQYTKYYITNTPEHSRSMSLIEFTHKCDASKKSYQAFSDLCENFSIDTACKIVSKDNGDNMYRGATLMCLTLQLTKMAQEGSMSTISSNTKKVLLKVYNNVVKDCERAANPNAEKNKLFAQLKENYESAVGQPSTQSIPGYEKAIAPLKEMYDEIFNLLKMI